VVDPHEPSDQGRASDRLPEDPVWRRVVADIHAAAEREGQDGYVDPVTGLYVMTAVWLWSRGSCCGSRCRHCPFDASG
jgi:hypothetical protein